MARAGAALTCVSVAPSKSGAGHFNMQIKVVVETEEQYDAWLAEQEEFLVREGSDEPEMEQAVTTEETPNATASL